VFAAGGGACRLAHAGDWAGRLSPVVLVSHKEGVASRRLGRVSLRTVCCGMGADRSGLPGPTIEIAAKGKMAGAVCLSASWTRPARPGAAISGVRGAMA